MKAGQMLKTGLPVLSLGAGLIIGGLWSGTLLLGLGIVGGIGAFVALSSREQKQPKEPEKKTEEKK